MPASVVKVTVKIPYSTITSQIQCRLPILIYYDYSVWRYLVLWTIFHTVHIIFIISYNIIPYLYNNISFCIRYVGIQECYILKDTYPYNWSPWWRTKST